MNIHLVEIGTFEIRLTEGSLRDSLDKELIKATSRLLKFNVTKYGGDGIELYVFANDANPDINGIAAFTVSEQRQFTAWDLPWTTRDQLNDWLALDFTMKEEPPEELELFPENSEEPVAIRTANPGDR